MFLLPLGDEPNSPDAPLVTYGLILVNCLVYLFITVPLSFGHPEWTDPIVQEYLGAWVDSLVGRVSQRDLVTMYRRLTDYDLLVFQWGFRPADPHVASLFTAMFLHGGFMHLAGNMLFLWICGDNVEHRIGRVRFLFAYLGTGVTATLFHTAFSGRSLLPLLGASGAIYGVAGVYFLWFPRNRVRVWVMLFPFFMNVVRLPARVVLGFYVVVQNLFPFLVADGTRGEGVAYGAHIGGFLGGLLVAWALNRQTLAPHATEPGRSGDTDAVTYPAGSLAALIEEGDYETAARRYVGFSSSETRRLLSERHSLMLGTWMAAKGHPHAALELFQRHLRDYPIGHTAAEAHVGAGLLQLRMFGQPTAAHQHLVEALELNPSPQTESRARQGLAQIAAIQRFQLSRM